MQNKYMGDAGDFGKYGLVRWITGVTLTSTPSLNLGIHWYLTPDGTGNKTFTDTVPANSRKTFNMADRIPQGRAAIVVTSKTPDKKIMVERAMYWNGRGAGTDTVGGFGDSG